MSQSLRHRTGREAEDTSNHSSSHQDDPDEMYNRQRAIHPRTNSSSLSPVGRPVINRDRNKILIVLAITVIYTTVLYRSGQSFSLP